MAQLQRETETVVLRDKAANWASASRNFARKSGNSITTASKPLRSP